MSNLSASRIARTAAVAAISSLALVTAGCGAKGEAKERETTASTADHSAQVERGKYLVMVGGCNDCHTPWKLGPDGPAPDESRLLSGHPQDLVITRSVQAGAPWNMTAATTNTAWSGPWGVSFTANLTPDRNTGLGAWSEDMFIQTLRTGRHWGQSRPILPPMPWFNYGKMKREDLAAIFAYLQAIPPVHNRVPEPLPPPAAAPAGGAI